MPSIREYVVFSGLSGLEWNFVFRFGAFSGTKEYSYFSQTAICRLSVILDGRPFSNEMRCESTKFELSNAPSVCLTDRIGKAVALLFPNRLHQNQI